MLINTLYAPHWQGGAARSVQELAEALAALDHQVLVLTLAPGSGDRPSELLNGVDVRRLDSGSVARPFVGATTTLKPVEKLVWQVAENHRSRLGRLVRDAATRFAPDVVHTNNIAGFGIGAWRAAPAPIVHTLRDHYLTCIRSQMFRRDELCDSQCLRCLVFKAPVQRVRTRPAIWVGVSEDFVDRRRRIGVIRPEDESGVVYNWPRIDRSLLRPRTRTSPVVFGLFGRIGEDKGTWIAIRAFQAMPSHLHDKVRLVIGGGASDQDLERLTRVMQDDSRIEYRGGGLRPETFYSSIDVALVPSIWFEPFGRVAAEARLTGVQVIASKVGGLPEALRTFEGDGVLVEDFTSAAAWTAAMTDAVGATSTRDTIADSSGTSTVALQYLDLYLRAGAPR